MMISNILVLLFLSVSTGALRIRSANAASSYVGYLISTFSDANPRVQFYLSKGNDPSTYTFLNAGKEVLTSTVGTKAVRDVFLATNDARDAWYMLGTDLDVNAKGFTWDRSTRHGSRSLVVWKSTNLVDWSASTLVSVETADAGMVWAPSAVWDSKSSQWNVFWSSRLYAASDSGHTGAPTLGLIRYATTKDFVTFSAPKTYNAPAHSQIIDQEFQYLGTPGHYARFFKNETAGSYIYQELSTNGVLGPWTRVPGNAVNEGSREGPAAFADNTVSGKYYMLLDNYTEYLPYETEDILSAKWRRATEWTKFPKGLKHGSVTPLTRKEYDAIAAKWA